LDINGKADTSIKIALPKVSHMNRRDLNETPSHEPSSPRKITRKSRQKAKSRTFKNRRATFETLERRHLLAAQITAFTLMNDTGNPTDNQTDDAHVRVQMYNPTGFSHEFAAQFDLNMDGTVDQTVPLSSTATLLEYDLGPFINAGPITAKVRLKEYNYYTQQQLYTSWSTLNFVYTGDGIPDINVFALVNDTGTPNDLITSDPRVKIAFGDGSAPQYVVEVDTNNDGVKDLWANSWPNNNAIFDLANLISPGQVQVKARVGAFSMQTGQYTFSGWDSFQFQYTGGSSGSTFKIDSLVLLSDTWIDGDKITSNPRVVLDFTVPSTVLGTVKVDFDTNADGIVDTYFNVAPDATVQFDPSNYIGYGNINLKARIGVLNPQTLVTSWSTLSYVYTNVFEPKLSVKLGSTALTNHSGMVTFGTAILDEPVDKVLTIKNDGLAQLTLDLNSFSATTGFSIPQLPAATLAAGASTQVTVRMNANTLGTKSGTLSFNSNDPNASFFDVSLAGDVVTSENSAPKVVNQLVDVLSTAGQTVAIDISGVFTATTSMTYSLVSISNPTLASGSLQGTTLTLNAGAISGNSNITVRATTPNGLFTEDTFILNIVQAGQTANQTVTIDLSNGRTAQQIETELRTAIQNANANGFHTNILFTLGNQDRVVEISQTAPIEILTHIKFFGPTDGYALTIKRVAGDQRVFTVAPNAKAEFSDLTIRGGRRQLGDGAGIWNAGELILNRVTLTDNVASNGYGAGLFNASLAIVTLGNVTLSGNQTQKWGAGIFNRGTLSADHVTFASNTAERGAAFFNEGTMNLFASLVADGVDGSHPHTELAVGTVTSRGFNVVTNAYGTTGFSAASDKLGGISGLPFINPGLRPLQNNGGASLTHALIANSPAIDIVSTTANDTLDQRGAPRIINTREQWIQSHRADAGAYEFGAFFVNVNADGTDLSTAGDGIADSNSTLAGDQISLRSAISEANQLTRFNASLNISYAQAATYIYFHPSIQPTLSLPGSVENGNLTGDLDILGNIVLIGQGTTKTIVRADYRDAQGTAVPDRVFHIHPNVSVRMESFRLRDGRADVGGGIFNEGASLALSEMLVGGEGGLYGIGGNAATLKGGGIYQKSGSLHLVDSSVVNNISLEGGGVYVESGTVVIEDDSHIDGNWAEVSGGGIAQIGGTIRVSSSTIQDNSMLELLSIPNSTSTDSKRRGAGIYTTGSSFILESESLLKNNKGATLGSGLFSDSTVQILSGSIVSNNGGQLQGSSIVSSQGGGIFNLGVLSLVDSKVEKNLGHEGAGIYNLTPGKLDVIRSSVSENNLDIYPLTAGAGIYNENGITKIESSTVSKNEGVHDAGGVYNYGLNAHLIISNSNFQGNWAVTTGGGVRNDSGTVEVYNSLFLENFTPYASSGFGGGIYHRGQNVLLGRLASKIELYAAVNTSQTSLHVNNVDSLLPLPLPINVRLNSEVMRIVAIDRVKGTVQVERTAGQTHSVTTPLELVDYIGLRELDTLGNNKFPLDIVIDNEVMRATSIIPGTNWVAVERGRQNTEIESHDTGALVHGISGSLTIANSTFSDNFSGVGGTSSDIVNYGGVIHSQIHPYVRPTVIESSTLVGNHRAETAAIFTEMLREDFPGKVLTPSGSFLQLNPVPKESTGVIPVWKSITETLYLSNSVIADGSDKAIMGQVQSGGNNVVDQDKVQAIPILGTISSTATTIELDSYLPTLEKTLASTLYWTPNIVAPFFPFQNPTSAHLPFKIKVSHTQIDPAGNSITVSETMRVTSVSGSLLTVERGIDGTTAVAHTGKVTAKINASGLWKSTDVVGAENQIEKSATTLLAPGGLTATADLLQVADSSRLPPLPFSVKVSYVIDNELLWEEMAVTEVLGNYLRVTRDSGVTHPHLSKVVVFSKLQDSIDAKIQALTQAATTLYTHIPNVDSPAAKLAAPTVQSTPLQSGLAADYHPSFDVFLSTSTVSGNYTLSTTLDSESTTLFLKETGLSLSLPAFAKLDQEIIRLVQYSSATQSYVIERGLQGTEKKPHQANSRVTLGTLISADATDTSFSVTLKSPLPPVPFIVAVGGELMNVTAVNAETGIVQVQRGQFGSTRTTHPPLRRASTELTLNTEVIMSVTLGNNLGKASPLYRPWKATLTAEINAQSQYIMVDSPPAAFEDYVAIDGEIFSVIRVPSDASKLRIISRGAFGSPTKNHSVGKMVEAGVVLALDPTVDATITAGSIVTRDGESMIVSAVFDDAMIVTRGANGTKAIDHPLSGSFNFGSSVDADDQYLLVRDSSTIKSFPAIAMVGNERLLILEDLGYGILRVQRGIHGTTANPIISGMKAASGTLIQVGSSELEIGSTIQVEQEQMQVRGFHSSSGLVVVERGTNGTLPASHQAGTFLHFGSASRPIALAGVYTSLTTPVTQASQTSMTVGALTEFPATPFFAALGNERIRVDAVVRNSDGTATLQTVRNLDGNVGSAYATGTNLVLLVDQNQWNRLKKATDPIYATPEIGSNATSRFVVNTTSDLADLSPGDGLVTTSVPGAVSLRAAIMEANALSQPVEIRLSGATYTLTSELEIRGDITLIGTSPSGTIVHGNGQRIFKVLPNARLKLDSLTLTGANSSVQGGAMLITGGSTEINRTIFSANSASSGGAIAITGGTLTIAQSTFMNNTASTDGGALASLGGQTILSYTTFSANSATGKGGAIYNATAGEIELRNTTLAYNQSAAGAGIHNVGKAKVGNSIIANQAYGQTDIKGTFTSLGSNIIGLTSSDVMLTSFVSSTSTTISLSNTQNLPAFPFSLRIGNETMTATSQSGSTFTVQRTNPLSHSPYQSVRLDGFWQTGDQTGSGYTAIDPKLQPLALGLGTVPTHALQSNSPAINAGNAALRLLHEVTVAESETTEFAGFQRDFKVIKVTEAATLPATPFFVQIGTETLEVIAKKGNTLTVKERKFPQPHARGAVVNVLTDARGLPSNNDIGAVELETTISLSTANASLTEDASGIGSQFTYTITRGGNVADRHEIYFVVNPSPNSRITPTDFGSDAFPMGKVVLEPGATSASFTISVASDTVVEPNEAFTVSILSPSAQVRKLVSSVTSTIVDNDTASLTTTAVTAVEGESMRYTVTLQGNVQGGLQLPWSLGASGDLATLADNDYIASSGVLNFVGTQGEKQYIEAITLQDQKVERHESLSVTTGTNLGVAPEMVSRISVPATLVGTIQNDDRTTIYISEVSKTELHSGSTSVSSGFTVWPNPVDTSLPLTLQVTSSNATLGSDYSVTTSTLTLPGTIGTQSSNVVSIVGDNTLETDEVVQIAATLTNRSDWSSFISVVSGKVTIVDDDGPTLAISDVIASESNSAGYIEFQVQLLNNNGNPLTIDLKTKNGTAIAGEDYQQTTRTLSFSGTSGETLTFQVPLLSDNKVELDESLSLEPVDPLALSGAGIRLRSGVGTIRNDDVANLQISPPLRLDDQAWHFEIRLSNPVDVPVTVTMSSTEIMASPTNHFSPSTTTFSLMSTSDVGRLVVNYQPQQEAARNIQVAPVSVSSSGRPVNLPQSQNAAIPVHQANAAACRPVAGDPLAPPPTMQFSGQEPAGYTFAYEINGIRVYTKPHGRTVASYEISKISQFIEMPDGHLIDETGEVWDEYQIHEQGDIILLKWLVFTKQMLPPPPGQPQPSGCPTFEPPAPDQAIDEELLKQELAKSAVKADWVIPHNQPFTFFPFPSFDFNKARDVGVTISDLSGNLVTTGSTVQLTYGTVTVNGNNSLTYTPNSNLSSREANRLKPELDGLGNIYRFTGIEGFSAHLVSKQAISSSPVAATTEKFASTPITLAVSNTLPTVRGSFLRQSSNADQIDQIFIERNSTLQVDLKSLYTDLDGQEELSKLRIVDVIYGTENLVKTGTTADPLPSQIRVPIGKLSNLQIEKDLILSATQNATGLNPLLLIENTVDAEATASNYPSKLLFTVVLTDGTKIPKLDSTGAPVRDANNQPILIDFTWKLDLEVVPQVDKTTSLWRNQSSIPLIETTPWIRKVSPSILERYKAETKETQPNRFEVTATVPTLDAAFQYDTIGDASVNLFNGTLLRSHELILDGSGGTSEMALGGLIYDSSTVPAASPSEQTNNFVIAKLKKSSDQVLTSLTFKLKWYDDQGLIETNVPVAATLLSQPEILVALRPERVPTKTGLYSWEIETIAEYAVGADNLPVVEIQVARGQSPVVVVDHNSNFGAGWSLAGMPTLTLSKGFDLAGGVNNKKLDDRFLLHFPGNPPALFNASEWSTQTEYEGTIQSIEYGSLGIGTSYRQAGESGIMTSRDKGLEIAYKLKDGTEYIFRKVDTTSDIFNLIRIEPPGVEYIPLTWNADVMRRGLNFTWEQPGNGNPSRLKSIFSSDKVETKLEYDPLNHVTRIYRDTGYQVSFVYVAGKIQEIRNLTPGSTPTNVQTARLFGYNLQGQLTSDAWMDQRVSPPKQDAITTFQYTNGFLSKIQAGNEWTTTSPGLVPHSIKSAISTIADIATTPSVFYATVTQTTTDLLKYSPSNAQGQNAGTIVDEIEYRYTVDGLIQEKKYTTTGVEAMSEKWYYTPLGDVRRSISPQGQESYYWYDYQIPVTIGSLTDPANDNDPTSRYDIDDFRGNLVITMTPQGLTYFDYETDDETGAAHSRLVHITSHPKIQGTTTKINGGPVHQGDTYFEYRNDGQMTSSQTVRGLRDPLPQQSQLLSMFSVEDQTLGDVIESFEYDTNGFVKTKTSPDGTKTSYVYAGRRLVTRVDGVGTPLETSTTYDYDNHGFVDKETVKNKSNQIVSIVDYNFDAFGQLNATLVQSNTFSLQSISATPTIQLTTISHDQFQYNSVGNLVRQENKEGVVHSFVYNNAGQLVSKTEAQGASYPSVYTNGNVSVSVNTAYQYYSDGSIMDETRSGGQVSQIQYFYDPTTGKSWEVVGGVSNGPHSILSDVITLNFSGKAISETTSDKFGRVVEEKNLLTGATTTYTYADPRVALPTTITEKINVGWNGSGWNTTNQVTKVDYDASGNTLATTESNRRYSVFNYDSLGQLIKTTTSGIGTSPTFGAEIDYRYDPSGRVLAQTETRRNPYKNNEILTTAFYYDDKNATHYVVDPLSQYDTKIEALWKPNASQAQTLGAAPPSVWVTSGRESGTAPATSSSTYEGGLIKTVSTDRTKLSTTQWTNGAGQVVKTLSALGAETFFEYDSQGQLIAELQKSPDIAGGTMTEHSYDQLGRLRSTMVWSSSQLLVTFTDYFSGNDTGTDGWNIVQYPVQNSLQSPTDAKNRGTRTKFDSIGNPVYVQQPDPDYLSNGNLASLFGNTPTTLATYTYQPDNQLVATTTRSSIAGNASGSFQFNTAYDAIRVSRIATNTAGQTLVSAVRTSNIDSPDNVQGNSLIDMGFVIRARTNYDELGNVLTTSAPKGDSADVNGQMQTVQYRYDDLGRTLQQLLPGQKSASYRYDSSNNVVLMEDDLGQWNRYDFDQLGRPLASESYAKGFSASDRDIVFASWNYAGPTTTYTNRNGWKTTTTFDPTGLSPYDLTARPMITKIAEKGNEKYIETRTLRSNGTLLSAAGTWEDSASFRKDYVANVDTLFDSLGRDRGSITMFGAKNAPKIRQIAQRDVLPNGLIQSQSLTIDNRQLTESIPTNESLFSEELVYDGLGRAVTQSVQFSQSQEEKWIGGYTPRDMRATYTYNADTLLSSVRSEKNATILTHHLNTNYSYHSDGTIYAVNYNFARYDAASSSIKTETANITNEYLSNGLLKKTTRNINLSNDDDSYHDVVTLQYDSQNLLQSQTKSYPGTGWAPTTIVAPSKAPGDRVPQDEFFNYKYDGEGNLVERTSRIQTQYVDDSATARVTYPNSQGTEAGRYLNSQTRAVGWIDGESATIEFEQTTAGVYDVWATWQENSNLGTGSYRFTVSDSVTRATRANLFKALTLDERTGFLRRSSEFMEEDQAEITVNFTSVPGNETHSDGHPWFPIATVQLDADSVLKLRLESLSGQVAVDGFKLVPHISKETFTYDNENRLLETQTYTQSSTSPAVITSYLYDPMGRLIVTNTDVVDKSTTQIGTIYQGQKPVLQFDMDPDLGNEIQSFKWFDSRGELIASHVNTTHSSQQPHPDELAATWHLNQLDGSEFTNTKSWMATEYVFAANKRGTVNSDPITELQKSTRSWHEGRYALSVESQEAAYRSWADPAHEILNYVGIIDPTGIADGINAVWYVGEGLMGREGAFLNAGISAAGALLPYAGDLLKFGKAGVQAAEACGAIKKLETNVILRQSAKSAAIGAASGAAIGGGISYAAGGDVWHGATQGALHGAVGGFSRNFFLNRYAKACFTAGTPLVVDLEGNSKPIEQIEVGEMVLARNEFEPNGPLELKRVEELFTRTSPIIELEIGGQKIGTTDEHPFYVPAREAFVPARELQVGDQLISHDGQLLRIDAIQSTLQIATVYNLRVTDYHTYFVGCDEWGWSVWAHNAKCGPALVNSREFRESHTRIFGDAGSSGHPTIIAQLQKHANTAAQRAKYTERQLASIQRSKNRAAAATDVAQREKHLRIAARKEKLFMGTQVDTEFKTLVADDPMIKSLGLSITPRGRFGPDIYDAKTKDYWELTTKADWLRGTHQNRYNGHFANGTGVFWS
jgi:YD repeat-containing protein